MLYESLTIAASHPQDPYMINVGLTPFTTTASALSLLLVFRTNASYGRWWEARKVSDSSTHVCAYTQTQFRGPASAYTPCGLTPVCSPR